MSEPTAADTVEEQQMRTRRAKAFKLYTILANTVFADLDPEYRAAAKDFSENWAEKYRDHYAETNAHFEKYRLQVPLNDEEVGEDFAAMGIWKRGSGGSPIKVKHPARKKTDVGREPGNQLTKKARVDSLTEWWNRSAAESSSIGEAEKGRSGNSPERLKRQAENESEQESAKKSKKSSPQSDPASKRNRSQKVAETEGEEQSYPSPGFKLVFKLKTVDPEDEWHISHIEGTKIRLKRKRSDEGHWDDPFM